MKGIRVFIPTLLKKIKEMLNDDMETVYLSICDETTDQGTVFPAFLHLEAFMNDGTAKDYGTVDEVSRLGVKHTA